MEQIFVWNFVWIIHVPDQPKEPPEQLDRRGGRSVQRVQRSSCFRPPLPLLLELTAGQVREETTQSASDSTISTMHSFCCCNQTHRLARFKINSFYFSPWCFSAGLEEQPPSAFPAAWEAVQKAREIFPRETLATGPIPERQSGLSHLQFIWIFSLKFSWSSSTFFDDFRFVCALWPALISRTRPRTRGHTF